MTGVAREISPLLIKLRYNTFTSAITYFKKLRKKYTCFSYFKSCPIMILLSIGYISSGLTNFLGDL